MEHFRDYWNEASVTACKEGMDFVYQLKNVGVLSKCIYSNSFLKIIFNYVCACIPVSGHVHKNTGNCRG